MEKDSRKRPKGVGRCTKTNSKKNKWYVEQNQQPAVETTTATKQQRSQESQHHSNIDYNAMPK